MAARLGPYRASPFPAREPRPLDEPLRGLQVHALLALFFAIPVYLVVLSLVYR